MKHSRTFSSGKLTLGEVYVLSDTWVTFTIMRAQHGLPCAEGPEESSAFRDEGAY